MFHGSSVNTLICVLWNIYLFLSRLALGDVFLEADDAACSCCSEQHSQQPGFIPGIRTHTPDIPQTQQVPGGTIFFLPSCGVQSRAVEKQKFEILLNKNGIKMLNKCCEILENLLPMAAVYAAFHPSLSQGQKAGKHEGRGRRGQLVTRDVCKVDSCVWLTPTSKKRTEKWSYDAQIPKPGQSFHSQSHLPVTSHPCLYDPATEPFGKPRPLSRARPSLTAR